MPNKLQDFDLAVADDQAARDKARSLVAGYAHDVGDARKLLDALGLSPACVEPVDNRRTLLTPTEI